MGRPRRRAHPNASARQRWNCARPRSNQGSTARGLGGLLADLDSLSNSAVLVRRVNRRPFMAGPRRSKRRLTMANFLLVYHGGGMPATEAERNEVMADWGAWFGKLGPAVVDAGNPTAPKAKSISSDGSVHDGAVGSAATGYSILKAESLSQAVRPAETCPVIQSRGKTLA